MTNIVGPINSDDFCLKNSYKKSFCVAYIPVIINNNYIRFGIFYNKSACTYYSQLGSDETLNAAIKRWDQHFIDLKFRKLSQINFDKLKILL